MISRLLGPTALSASLAIGGSSFSQSDSANVNQERLPLGSLALPPPTESAWLAYPPGWRSSELPRKESQTPSLSSLEKELLFAALSSGPHRPDHNLEIALQYVVQMRQTRLTRAGASDARSLDFGASLAQRRDARGAAFQAAHDNYVRGFQEFIREHERKGEAVLAQGTEFNRQSEQEVKQRLQGLMQRLRNQASLEQQDLKQEPGVDQDGSSTADRSEPARSAKVAPQSSTQGPGVASMPNDAKTEILLDSTRVTDQSSGDACWPEYSLENIADWWTATPQISSDERQVEELIERQAQMRDGTYAEKPIGTQYSTTENLDNPIVYVPGVGSSPRSEVYTGLGMSQELQRPAIVIRNYSTAESLEKTLPSMEPLVRNSSGVPFFLNAPEMYTQTPEEMEQSIAERRAALGALGKVSGIAFDSLIAGVDMVTPSWAAIEDATQACEKLILKRLLSGKGIDIVGHSQGGIIAQNALVRVNARFVDLVNLGVLSDGERIDALKKVRLIVVGSPALEMNWPDDYTPQIFNKPPDPVPLVGFHQLQVPITQLDIRAHYFMENYLPLVKEFLNRE